MGAGESEEPFICLLLCMINGAVLRDFDRGQILMARKLGISITETA